MERKFDCCLWINGHAQEVADFYLASFAETSQNKTMYFVDDLHGKTGDILTISLTLAGQDFILLNGGPEFTPTPAVSYIINCNSMTQLVDLWDRLSQDGEILMPLEDTPGVGLFGWLNDRYGVSWQLRLGSGVQTITPCFLFANELYGQAKAAVQEWLEIFGQGKLLLNLPDDKGNYRLAKFQLYDQHLFIMDSSIPHNFGFSMANSFCIYCEDQAEIDRLWEAVTAEGEEYPCGWMMDRFGVSWQTITRDLDDLLDARHLNKARQTTLAMYDMKKIDIELLRKVYQETDE